INTTETLLWGLLLGSGGQSGPNKTPNTSLSTSGITFTDRQSSTALTSTSLNGTTKTTPIVGTSANTLISTGVVTSSNNQSSTAQTSTSSNGENGQSKHLIIIVIVVVAVLLITAITVAVIMLHRRRHKKLAGEDASNLELTNHDFTSNNQSPLNVQTVETSNYEHINDKYIATCYIPAREENDSANQKIHKTNGQAGTIDAYDRIEFAKKCAVKLPNYDCVSALEVKKVDDTYSHISNQPKPASAPTTNDYSHGQYVSKDLQSKDYPNKITLTNEADNYSHVNLDSDRTPRTQSYIAEDDSYTHIDIDNTINASRNQETASLRTIYKSDEGYPTLKEDLQSLDVDRSSGVTSQASPLQDIKAVSLPYNYIEFKVGDIYDTPRCKDKQ
ncbi:hypothetical protein ACJMK2_028848, partial [Sinanodonta woodiana]